YFDVEVEYAKVAPHDLLIRISVTNRGPDPAPLHLLPTLWFRNTWSWGRDDRRPAIAMSPATAAPSDGATAAARPMAGGAVEAPSGGTSGQRRASDAPPYRLVQASHHTLGAYWL